MNEFDAYEAWVLSRKVPTASANYTLHQFWETAKALIREPITLEAVRQHDALMEAVQESRSIRDASWYVRHSAWVVELYRCAYLARAKQDPT